MTHEASRPCSEGIYELRTSLSSAGDNQDLDNRPALVYLLSCSAWDQIQAIHMAGKSSTPGISPQPPFYF